MQDNQRQAVLYYLAGIIDGEGCIRMGKQKYQAHPNWNPQFYGCISVGMVNKQVIELLRDTFTPNRPNKIYTERVQGRKPVYRWIARKDQEVMAILKELHPLLLIKKEQAEIVMAFLESKNTKGFQRNKGLPPQELRWREGLFQQMKTLNAPGAVATTK